jgi:dihydroorotate dehydrogenase (fumarate)
MNLTTRYLGLELKNPLVVGASPFGDNVYVAQELQDAGASAIIMRSLFEEQVDAEQQSLVHHLETTANSNPEGTSYFPHFDEYQLAPDQYLHQLAQLKSTLTIPVIASLNGCRPGGWINYARRLESAGADAIELNLYQLVTDPALAADDVEADMLQTVRNAVEAVRIPLAVKLSSFHTAPVHFAKALESTGVAGLVVFNRFYQPDFNIEELEVQPQLRLSDSSELLLRLRWLAILSPHLRCSLAASGGVHQAEDVVKALLAGADVVQVVSALLKHGPKLLTILLAGLRHWMDEHGYTSLTEVRGAMNLRRCPNPAAFERANYQRILQSWRI